MESLLYLFMMSLEESKTKSSRGSIELPIFRRLGLGSLHNFILLFKNKLNYYNLGGFVKEIVRL